VIAASHSNSSRSGGTDGGAQFVRRAVWIKIEAIGGGAGADAGDAAGYVDHPAAAELRARSLRERIFQHFSQKAMVEGVLAGYRDAFAAR